MHSSNYTRSPIAIALTVLFFIAMTGLGGAPATTPDSEPKTKTDTKGTTEVIVDIQDFRPIPELDSRFLVTGVNFERRYSPTGLGEFLDVVFDIKNLTSKPIELYAFVLAYNESNAVYKPLRRVVPFPGWRNYDRAKDLFLVHYMTITPGAKYKFADAREEKAVSRKVELAKGSDGKKVEINTKTLDPRIWDKTDHQYRHYRRLIQKMRDSVAIRRPLADVHPPFWKYISFMAINPTMGLPFTLHGRDEPGEADSIQTDFIRPSAEEKETKVYKSINKHTFTLEHHRRHTVFRSHHYSKFRGVDYRYFNMVSIVLIDAKKAQKFESELKPILPQKRALQLKRIDLDRRRKIAEDAGNDEELDKIIGKARKDGQGRTGGEEAKLLVDELEMQKKMKALIKKYNHMSYQKTYHLRNLKRHP